MMPLKRSLIRDGEWMAHHVMANEIAAMEAKVKNTAPVRTLAWKDLMSEKRLKINTTTAPKMPMVKLKRKLITRRSRYEASFSSLPMELMPMNRVSHMVCRLAKD